MRVLHIQHQECEVFLIFTRVLFQVLKTLKSHFVLCAFALWK